MKKSGILNRDINALIGELGHKDRVVICDAGLPIPDESLRIDLSLTQGIPHFMDVLTAMLKEVAVEKIILAEQIKVKSPALHESILKAAAGIPVEYIPHIEFKELTKTAKGIIRTGEFTSFANIQLVCGCVF